MVSAAEMTYSIFRQFDEDRNTAVLTKIAGANPDRLLKLLEDDQNRNTLLEQSLILQITQITRLNILGSQQKVTRACNSSLMIANVAISLSQC